MILGKNRLKELLSIAKGMLGFLIIYESIVSLMIGDWQTCAIGVLIGSVLIYFCFCDLTAKSEEKRELRE